MLWLGLTFGGYHKKKRAKHGQNKRVQLKTKIPFFISEQSRHTMYEVLQKSKNQRRGFKGLPAHVMSLRSETLSKYSGVRSRCSGVKNVPFVPYIFIKSLKKLYGRPITPKVKSLTKRPGSGTTVKSAH